MSNMLMKTYRYLKKFITMIPVGHTLALEHQGSKDLFICDIFFKYG